MNVVELVEIMRLDLITIDTNIRWAHTDGFHPAHADTSKPRFSGFNATGDVRPPSTLKAHPTEEPPEPERPTDANDDQQPGARYDIGVGDHRSRTAYQNAARRLWTVDRRLAEALIGQPQPDVDWEPGELWQTLGGITRIRMRLGLIVNRPETPELRRLVENAAQGIDRTWHILNSVFERGTLDGRATEATLCRICRIRARADKKGGRCSTCDSYQTRHGVPRPRKLDAVNDARQALERRQRRGDGWGDESFTAVTVRQAVAPVEVGSAEDHVQRAVALLAAGAGAVGWAIDEETRRVYTWKPKAVPVRVVDPAESERTRAYRTRYQTRSEEAS